MTLFDDHGERELNKVENHVQANKGKRRKIT